MTRNPFRIGLLSIALLCAPLRAEDEKDLRELLRDALYTEEVTRDPEAAAKQYEALLSRHEAQRAFAASALFRLAEVRRKQDRKDDAIALYQKLLARFPEAATEVKLARENLAAMGGKVAEENAPAENDDDRELKRLEVLAKTNPDALADPSIPSHAVRFSQLRVLKYFLEKNPGYDLNGSPDSNHDSPLVEASRAAALEACRILLDAGADPNAPVNRHALPEACSEGYLRIVELLLERGADPNGHGTFEPLRYAVADNRPEIVSLLIKKGADPNRPVAAEANADGILSLDTGTLVRSGAPIHVASTLRDVKMLNLLLELGADPNLAEPSTGLTALHIALYPGHEPGKVLGNPAAVPLLLKAGAKPEPGTKEFRVFVWGAPHPLTIPAGTTPLAFAAQHKNLEAAEQLIEAGASAKRPGMLSSAVNDPDMFRLLLKHGADSNERDGDGVPLLIRTIRENQGEIFRALILAGADPQEGSTNGMTPLQEAAKKRETWPLAEILIGRGATPDEGWKKNLFRGADLPNRSQLVRRFLFPEAATRPAITAFREPTVEGVQPALLELVARKEDEAPPSMLDLLLSRGGRKGGRDGFHLDEHNPSPWPTAATLTRLKSDGTVQEIKIDLTGDQPFPSLAWGDVFEFQRTDNPPVDPEWALRKRVNFPVAVEIEGKTRTLEVRGDCLMFDATSDVVPWLGAGALMRLLWQPLDPSVYWNKVGIVVVRPGWQDVRLPFGGGGPSDFALQAGDTLKLILPPPPADAPARPEGQWWETPAARLSRVTLRVPGHPFVRHFGVSRETEARPLAPTVPTLLQALADVLASESSASRDVAPEGLVRALIRDTYFSPVVILPHPDFSKIRLRRMLDDGKEEVREIDLAAVIAASTEATTADDARKADVVLQGGDIIELVLHEDRKGETWKGLTAREAAFFSKALSCRVQYTDTSGKVELRDVTYQPASFVETEAGWYPFPPDPKQATATLRASRALSPYSHSSVIVDRGGVKYEMAEQNGSVVFLRDGDAIRMMNIPVPGAQSIPRSR